MTTLVLDNDMIKSLYVDKLLNIKEIATQLGVHHVTVAKRLHTMGVMRNRSEYLKTAYQLGKIVPAQRKATNEQIKTLFDEGLTPWQIAKKLGYRNSSNILVRLHRMKLITTPYEYHLHGKDHYNWKGGVWKDGYILIYKPDYYRATSRGYVREHILVWEEYHQTRLPKGYLIHHLNGIKNDNRPENLVAMKYGEHVHQAEPFKVRIRELEIENRQLKRALEDTQITNISEN